MTEKLCEECGVRKPIEKFRMRRDCWIPKKCNECIDKKSNKHSKDSYQRNIVERRKKSRTRWNKDKEKYMEMSRKWERMRKEKYEGKIVGSHTYKEWLEKLREYDYKCRYCKCKIYVTKDNKNPHQATRDHIVSLHDLGTDYISNIVPCCRRCNSSKGKGLRPKTKFGGAV